MDKGRIRTSLALGPKRICGVASSLYSLVDHNVQRVILIPGNLHHYERELNYPDPFASSSTSSLHHWFKFCSLHGVIFLPFCVLICIALIQDFWGSIGMAAYIRKGAL